MDKNNIKLILSGDGRDIFDYPNLSNNLIIKNIIGFFIFVVLFGISLPVFFYKNALYTILEVYLPNLDLLANLLSFHGGPENYKIFEYLYMAKPSNTYAFFSQTIINYMALLGVTYIIARETKLTNSIVKGWSLAFVMILVTYLLPSQFISNVMENINTFLSTKTKIHSTSIWIIAVLFGFIMTISIILFERYILSNFRNLFITFGSNIIDFPERF
jgi:hypothetical protein